MEPADSPQPADFAELAEQENEAALAADKRESAPPAVSEFLRSRAPGSPTSPSIDSIQEAELRTQRILAEDDMTMNLKKRRERQRDRQGVVHARRGWLERRAAAAQDNVVLYLWGDNLHLATADAIQTFINEKIDHTPEQDHNTIMYILMQSTSQEQFDNALAAADLSAEGRGHWTAVEQNPEV